MQMQSRSRKHDVFETAVCNIAGTFATDTRCWNFVSKLFRSRIYEVPARKFVAKLPNVVSKLARHPIRRKWTRMRANGRRSEDPLSGIPSFASICVHSRLTQAGAAVDRDLRATAAPLDKITALGTMPA